MCLLTRLRPDTAAKGNGRAEKEWNFHKESSCFGDGTAADGGV